MPVRRVVDLPTGTLTLRVDEAGWAINDLCNFAARDNPRRGFLVVSKVLGRHIPAAPTTMRAAVRDLAARVPADLEGPILVVGLAETAVCLGQTLHDELRRQTGRGDIGFIHSTRHRIDRPLLCRFEEPHSHASAHLIYCPADLPPPRSVVLVDDEISTGTTLTNLATALTGCWPGIERFVAATLTDWSGDGEWLARMPRPTQRVRLLGGSLDWKAADKVVAAEVQATFDARAATLGTLKNDHNDGRFGILAPVDPMPPLPSDPPHRLRIVGTGEFTWLPFRLAEMLAARGHDVVVQATSRSPARIGGAITTALHFNDNYRTGVPNHLYNADPNDDRATWICHETGADSIDPALIEALDARLIDWTQR